MSSQSRSIRRANARANAPEANRKGMTLPQVLNSFAGQINDLKRLVEELEKVVEEHDKKLNPVLNEDPTERG